LYICEKIKDAILTRADSSTTVLKSA